MADCLVIGGAHLDRRATLAETSRSGASNPGHWREEPGGGSFNAARGLAQLGNCVRLVSVRGGDRAGETVARAVESAGLIDMTQVFLDRATPSYSAVLEPNGDLVIGVAEMDLYDRFTKRQLSRKHIRAAIEGAEMILCDANLPAETLTALARQSRAAQKPLAAIAISPAKIHRLTGALPMLSVLFLNEMEAAALCGSADGRDWPAALRRAGVQSAVVTRGARPVVAFDRQTCFEISPPAVDDIADVTGAGDALAAATLDRLAGGASLDRAVRAGVAAAGLAVRAISAVPADLTPKALDAAAALVPEPVFLP